MMKKTIFTNPQVVPRNPMKSIVTTPQLVAKVRSLKCFNYPTVRDFPPRLNSLLCGWWLENGRFSLLPTGLVKIPSRTLDSQTPAAGGAAAAR